MASRINSIDGLRAVAVSAVILFHLFPKTFPGGFIGVDIFYVISGYLVSKKFFDGRSIAIWEFYKRRISRIVPAFYFMLICTGLLVLIFLNAAQIASFFKAAVSALIFIPNIYFMREDYFAEALEGQSLILHTWSLGVEEQFYIFFPLALIVFSRFNFHWPNKVVNGLILLFIVLNLLMIQFGGNLKATYPFVESDLKFAPESYYFNYFSPLSRVWEFLAGIYLARIGLSEKRSGAALISAVALSVLVLYIFLVPAVAQPNLFTAVPIISIVSLMYFSRSDNFIYSFLSNRVLVYIGLMSYSLYLWHQPVITFLKLTFLHYDPNLIALALIPVFCISWISYNFVEKRFSSAVK